MKIQTFCSFSFNSLPKIRTRSPKTSVCFLRSKYQWWTYETEVPKAKFKDSICAESCLKLWFESDWYFCKITESGWFWKWQPRNNAPSNHFLKLAWKSISPEVHCGIWYQFSHTRFDQISDHKRDIPYLLEWAPEALI